MDLIKDQIKAEAINLGFSFIGFTEPRQTPHFKNYLEWIHQGNHSGLDYLFKPYVIQGRRQPETLLEGAKTVIVAGIHYIPQTHLREIAHGYGLDRGWIASYGCLPDYHKTLKEKFRKLAESIGEIIGHKVKNKLFIDSGPVMEKDFAMQAGLGWIGKNSLLITPQFGSYCLLGCLFIDLDLPSDTPMSGDVCDGCEICIRACPTDCINQNRTIQADRCISYQTIENPLEIPRYLTEKMDGWVFGCDICQMVCPENRKAAAKAQDISAAQKPLIPQSVKLSELESIHGDKFVEIFAGTPVTRVGFNNFQRNILNASSNQKKKQLSN